MISGWTILFFIYAEDNKTKEYAELLLRALCETEDSPELTLLVFESVYQNDNDDAFIEGRLLELKYLAGETKRRRELRKDFGELNPGNPGVLKKVLKYIKDKELLREKFLLFTWDHGLGFGIFDGDPGDAPANLASFMLTNNYNGTLTDKSDRKNEPSVKIMTNRRSPLLKAASDKNIAHSSVGKLFDIGSAAVASANGEERPINMLTNREINEALSELGRKTDLVIMMNCWMQMLETGYELEQTVNLLVAAETVHFFAGYDYKTIINEIARNPDISADTVASITVATVENSFASSKFSKNLDEIIISATNLNELNNVKPTLEKLWKELLERISKKFINIRATRRICKDLSEGYLRNSDNKLDLMYFIDFNDYIAQLAAKGLFAEDTIKEFSKALEKYIPYKYIGKKFEKINPKTNLPLGHGVSIYHPYTGDNFNDLYFTYFYRNKSIEMAKTPWSDFLELYHKKTESNASGDTNGTIGAGISIVCRLKFVLNV